MRKRQRSKVEEKRDELARKEHELREWLGRQETPVAGGVALAYHVRLGELEKLRDALRRLELKEKRRTRELAQVELGLGLVSK